MLVKLLILLNLFTKKEESGFLSLVGKGSHFIKLPFNPRSFRFEIKDDPNDTHLSCNPAQQDQVQVSIKKIHFGYYIKIKWNILRVKTISWGVKNH